MSAEPDPPPKKLTFKAAEFEAVNPPSEPDAPPAHDPLDLLRANRAHEKANNSIYDQSPAPVPRKWHKYRDYFLLLALVDGGFGFLLTLNLDAVALVYIISLILVFTSGWSWIMLVLIDDY